MVILGISAFFHDSAACIVRDGRIEVAIQEERLSRKKNDPSFPWRAILACLEQAKLQPLDIDIVVFEKPILKFDRILETQIAFAPKGFKQFKAALPTWLTEKLYQKATIAKHLTKKIDPLVKWKEKLRFSSHHLSHAASAYYPSPFSSSAIITTDGVGEWATTTVGVGKQENIELLQQINFPHSLGLLYSAFTHYLGFKVNSGEYKVMGLAPYGSAKYSQTILDHLIELHADGSFQLNLSYFDYCVGDRMINEKFESLFRMNTREPESDLCIKHADVAASVQDVLNKALINLANAAKTTGEKT